MKRKCAGREFLLLIHLFFTNRYTYCGCTVKHSATLCCWGLYVCAGHGHLVVTFLLLFVFCTVVLSCAPTYEYCVRTSPPSVRKGSWDSIRKRTVNARGPHNKWPFLFWIAPPPPIWVLCLQSTFRKAESKFAFSRGVLLGLGLGTDECPLWSRSGFQKHP